MNKLIFIPLLLISTTLYADNKYEDELKSIYKQQYQIKNSNTILDKKIEKYINLELINNTNIYHRQIINLLEKQSRNDIHLERLDNRIEYLNHMNDAVLVSSNTNNSYKKELRRIYKQKLQLKNANLYLEEKINRYLKFEEINYSNTRQRQILKTFNKITQNEIQLEELDNRIEFIYQILSLEIKNPIYLSQH